MQGIGHEGAATDGGARQDLAPEGGCHELPNVRRAAPARDPRESADPGSRICMDPLGRGHRLAYISCIVYQLYIHVYTYDFSQIHVYRQPYRLLVRVLETHIESWIPGRVTARA